MGAVENKSGSRLGAGRRRRGTVLAQLSAAAVVVLVLALALPRLSVRTAPAETQTPQKSAAQNGATPAARATVQRNAANVETSLSPLLVGTGVLHIKGIASGRTSAGEESDQLAIEFWYDRDTGDALYHRREIGDTRP